MQSKVGPASPGRAGSVSQAASCRNNWTRCSDPGAAKPRFPNCHFELQRLQTCHCHRTVVTGSWLCPLESFFSLSAHRATSTELLGELLYQSAAQGFGEGSKWFFSTYISPSVPRNVPVRVLLKARSAGIEQQHKAGRGAGPGALSLHSKVLG